MLQQVVVGDLVTESTTTTNSERKKAAFAVKIGAESTPLRAAAASTPVLSPLPVPVPVPATRSLRMFLGVLKHKPAGVIREVGVLLMLHVSSTEVAIASGAAAPAVAAAAAETPSAQLSQIGCAGGGRGGRGIQPQTKQHRESADFERRAQEAAAVLALALSTEKRRVGCSAAGGATAPRLAKNNKTRFQHQLRQPAKVEDRLQAWAATRGREVAALKELLALSALGELRASSAGARLVRDRAGRIPVGQVEKVR